MPVFLPDGTRLGPYEILAPLGAGGMGEVYRARDTRLGRSVAIKVLPERLAEDREALKRFEQEARAVASLSHPNILSIHDFGSSDATVFAVMELLEGESLDRRIAQENLSWRKAIEIGTAIANGLAAAHSRGIIHRDLKPANVFVTQEGHVKILDFGLAKHSPLHPAEQSTLSKLQTETGAGIVLGTLGYMSPEQASGKPADARSDIFALGCVLYEMLSGRRAFARGSAGETIAAILRDQPPDLLETAQNIPPAVISLVRRCLEKNPEERFQSARDLSFALKETLSGSTYIGHQTSPMATERVGRLTRWVLPLVVLVIIAAGVVLFSPKLSFKDSQIKSLAVLPITNISGDPEQEYWADAITEQLISDLALLGNIRVPSRTSAMSYKGAKKPLSQIAKELRVEAILEGSFVRSGQRIKISVDLVQASPEKHLWANTYEREVEDILNIQAEIARSIAGSIQLRLSPEISAKLSTQKDRVDSHAYESYVKGRYFLNKRTRMDLTRAVENFHEALDSDPAYAAAYSGLADSYALQGYMNYEPPDQSFPKAKAAARRALELESSLAEAHASLGYVSMYYDWDFKESESEFRKAISLNSNLASAHHFYGIYLAAMLRPDEAEREIREARNLDPLSVSVATDMGFVLYYDRNYDDATKVLKDAIAMNPKSAPAHWWLGRIYQAENKYHEAAEEYVAAGPGLSEWPPALASLGHLYGIWGKRAEALKIINDMNEMSKQGYVSPYALALVYLGLGDEQQTFTFLNRSYTGRANWMVWLLKDPRWDRLRSDPRFIEIIQKVGFPKDAQERAPKGSGS